MYFIKRIFFVAPTLLCLSLLCFFLLHVMPGNPLTSTQTERYAPSTALALEPWGVRYADWLSDLVRGDWGQSFYYGENVLRLLSAAIWPTLSITLSATVIAYLFALCFGALMIRYRWCDRLLNALLVLYSIPNIIFGIALLAFFKDYFPLQGITSDGFDSLSPIEKLGDLAWHMTLPVFSIAVALAPYLSILVRNALQEELSQDYIRAAKARGVNTFRLLTVHASRGVLFSLSTSFGREIAWLLSGTLFLETLFGIPGIGKLAYDSFLRRDAPVLMGIVLLAGMLQIFGNLLADYLYQVLHPKVRLT